jgi:hypothetical protein
MTQFNRDKRINILLAAFLATTLVACNHDDDDDMQSMTSYEITVVNASNGQPLTPVAVVAHTSGYEAFMLGSAASVGLEMLAEGGDISQFITDANANANVAATGSSANGPFGPGASETVTVDVTPDSNMQISVASMLANTNDAFTGLDNVSVGNLMMGESISKMAHVYDAGTEGNSETAATMPGPAANGEGFNVARDDTNFVSIHAGVVTSDDGLTTSALDESHRWLGAATKITITRVQ